MGTKSLSRLFSRRRRRNQPERQPSSSYNTIYCNGAGVESDDNDTNVTEETTAPRAATVSLNTASLTDITTAASVDTNNENDKQRMHLAKTDNAVKFAKSLPRNRPTALSLDISSADLKENGLDTILTYLQDNSDTLLDLRLEGSSSKHSAKSTLKRILTAMDITTNTSLQRLSFFNLRLDESSVQTVMQSNVADVSFECCSMEGNVQQAFASSCDSSLHLIGLQEELLAKILHTLQQNVKSSSNANASSSLTYLDVSYASSKSALALASLLSTCNTISRLTIRDSSLLSLEPIVRSLLRSKSSVESLDIINCDVDAISAALLRILFSSQNNQSSHSSRHHRQLRYVCLADVDFGNDFHTFQTVLDGLALSRVRRLKLHHVLPNPAITSYDCELLIQQLLQSNPHLERLDLDRQFLQALQGKKMNPFSFASSRGSSKAPMQQRVIRRPLLNRGSSHSV